MSEKSGEGHLDGFAEFLLDVGVVETLARFPDARQRRSIPIFFFCHTLVYRPLFRLTSLAQIGDVLFRSPYILRQLGFNAQHVAEGFYQTEDGQKPFDEEAIGECFARNTPRDFVSHQLAVLGLLVERFPRLFYGATWAMDSIHFTVPKGKGSPGGEYKVCVLGLVHEDVVWPLLWRFAPAQAADLPLGKSLVAAVQAVGGEGVIYRLLLDRAFIDGAWITRLWEQGVQVHIGLRSDMTLFEDLQFLARSTPAEWESVPPPKNHQPPLPTRQIVGFSHLDGWSTCQAPLCGCLIRDTYPDRVAYQATVMTGEAEDARTIYDGRGQRWLQEEVFMSLTRYWLFDRLAPCRQGVAFAAIHFALLAFTLLGLYRLHSGEDARHPSHNTAPPPLPVPERELAVYAGPFFALLLPSELVFIILSHVDAWQSNQEQLILALRLAEGRT